MKAIVFPGQGSQHKGMGKDLFDQVVEFGLWESEIDECLGYSLRELCINNPDNLLSQTQYTQPCLYVVNSISYIHWLKQTNEIPSTVIGHSLGEYNALWAGGAYNFMTGLHLVKKRGELMAKIKGGGMLAIVGLEIEKILDLLGDSQFSELDVANKNAPEQTIISGPTDSISKVSPILEKAGARMCMPLPVSAAFHSRYMMPIREEFSEYLKNFEFKALRKTVISNVTANPYSSENPNEVIPSLLSQQITSPVEWVKIIQKLIEKHDMDFQEIGPGTVLTDLITKIRRAQTDHLVESSAT